MPTQQILRTPAQAAMFMVLTVEDGVEDEVLDFLADASGLTRSVSFRSPDSDLNCVYGIGAKLWDRLYDLPRPAKLHTFEEIAGERHTAVSTPGDLHIHLRARRLDMCFELARLIMNKLQGKATVTSEVHGFKYFDERDLLGFVDGTENPEGVDAENAVTIGDEDSDYAGGSYVLIQKYTHDLDAWQTLSVEDQEKVIGRTKLEDIEMSDEVKPSNSHVALNTIEDEEGNQLQIVRDNMVFGVVGTQEFGTYFIGYAADPGVIEEMLRNMFIGKPPGNTDQILEFSTAVTGALFFVPTVDFLDDPPSADDARTEAPDGDSDPEKADIEPAREPHLTGTNESKPHRDGSLSIGSLRHA